MVNTIFNAVLSFGLFFGGLIVILLALLLFMLEKRMTRPDERRFNEWDRKGDEPA